MNRTRMIGRETIVKRRIHPVGDLVSKRSCSIKVSGVSRAERELTEDATHTKVTSTKPCDVAHRWP